MLILSHILIPYIYFLYTFPLNTCYTYMVVFASSLLAPGGRDRIVVSTLRCGRNNPGSNPGHGSGAFLLRCTLLDEKGLD